MKVVVLGGAGEMGSRAVEDLAVSDAVETVTIADRDIARAEKIAGGLPPHKADVRVTAVDATDHRSLVKALKDHDVVASALGPFYFFEGRLVTAALDAGIDYVSICDDWPATLDVFIRFEDAAREKGVTVITGCGASPGFTNMAVRLLAEKLDSVESVGIYVFVPMDSSEGEATIKHTLFVYGTTVPVFADATMSALAAGSVKKVVEFPVAGRVKVWNVGHSEPVTIPRYFPGVKNIDMMMGLGRGTGALVVAGRLGVFKSPRRRDLITSAAVRLMRPQSPSSAEGAVRVDVSGVKDGQTVTLTACGTATMRDATGLALSVGAVMLGTGRLTTEQKGVFAPEGCLDAAAFIEMMGSRGVGVYADLAMTRALVP